MKNCKFLEKAFFLLAAGVTLFTMQACEEKEEPVLLPNVDREDMMEAIDLGLPSGTLWASCNLGASSPEEYGDYFAWGETDVKDGYSWQTYQWCNGTYESMSTDCVDSVELNQQYDAAFAKWGDQWRMPTVADFKELVTECTWTWTAQNGVKGYLVTGSNENSIFLPAAGCQRDGTILHGGYTGCYWSTTLYESDTQHAHLLYFNNDSYSYKFRNFRVDGRSVRPITGGGNVSDEPEEDEDKPSEGDEDDEKPSEDGDEGKDEPSVDEEENPSEGEEDEEKEYTGMLEGHEWVDLGLSVKWATCNIGADSPEDYGDYFAWGEIEPKENYSLGTYIYYNENAGYTDIGSNISGTQYDVAHVKWGGGWRMPTREEFEELLRCYTFYYTDYCLHIRGDNGYSIYLPAARSQYGTEENKSVGGCYWSATLKANTYSYYLHFDDVAEGPSAWSSPYGVRSEGYTIRPVCE